MKPGATMRSVASIVRAARAETSPTATMRPPAIATSALDAGAPVPSTTVPPRMRRSQSIEPRDVVVQDRIARRLRKVGGLLAQHVLRPRPRRVAVREVVPPHEALGVLEVDGLERRPVVLEREVDVLAERLRRQARELRGAHVLVALVVVVHAVHPVGHPAGIRLDAHDAKLRMALEDAAVDEH